MTNQEYLLTSWTNGVLAAVENLPKKILSSTEQRACISIFYALFMQILGRFCYVSSKKICRCKQILIFSYFMSAKRKMFIL